MRLQAADLAVPAAFSDEGAGGRWLRRAVTISTYAALAAFVAAALPLLALVALAIDAVRRRRFAATRCLAMLLIYLACEIAGIAVSSALWLARRLRFVNRKHSTELHYRLQLRWAQALLAGARHAFALDLEVEGEEQIPGGPVLVLARHASLADTLLPANLLTRRHGIRLRYVLKRELLWDPCLDLVGNRLPNVFVRRGSGDSAREIDAVRRCAGGIGAREGVLIYPEGTRFSAAKLERARARLAAGNDPARLARAQQLRGVLPPRLGGVLALLEGAPRADVLFLGHVGLEETAHLRQIWNGALVGRSVRVKFWRVARADVPSTQGERIAWLDGEWANMDEWVAQRRAAG